MHGDTYPPLRTRLHARPLPGAPVAAPLAPGVVVNLLAPWPTGQSSYCAANGPLDQTIAAAFTTTACACCLPRLRRLRPCLLRLRRPRRRRRIVAATQLQAGEKMAPPLLLTTYYLLFTPYSVLLTTHYLLLTTYVRAYELNFLRTD